MSREGALRQEFEISNEGAVIPYVGAMVKRGPYMREEFVEIKSGGAISFEVRLDLDYEFLPGRNSYQSSYILIMYDPLQKDVVTVKSAPINFDFAR